MYYYWKSEYVTEIADDVIETLVAFAATMTPCYPSGRIPTGDTIQRHDEQVMAVSHRKAEYLMAINIGWAGPQDTEH